MNGPNDLSCVVWARFLPLTLLPVLTLPALVRQDVEVAAAAATVAVTVLLLLLVVVVV
jgi:hypothetical protein